MRRSADALSRGRGFRTRHILDAPLAERAGRLLWRVGMAGACASAFANVALHMLVYGTKAWVSTPATVGCLLMTVVSMGAAVLGSLLRSVGGGR